MCRNFFSNFGPLERGGTCHTPAPQLTPLYRVHVPPPQRPKKVLWPLEFVVSSCLNNSYCCSSFAFSCFLNSLMLCQSNKWLLYIFLTNITHYIGANNCCELKDQVNFLSLTMFLDCSLFHKHTTTTSSITFFCSITCTRHQLSYHFII